MKERFTPEEINLAAIYIKRIEKNSKVMKFMKWFILVCAIVLIGSSAFLLVQCQKVERMNTTKNIMKGNKLQNGNLEEYIDARIELLRIEFEFVRKSYHSAIFGGILIGLFIVTWSWQGRNRLIVKGLRMLIALSKNDHKY